jgi:hypothetical protein
VWRQRMMLRWLARHIIQVAMRSQTSQSNISEYLYEICSGVTFIC